MLEEVAIVDGATGAATTGDVIEVSGGTTAEDSVGFCATGGWVDGSGAAAVETGTTMFSAIVAMPD